MSAILDETSDQVGLGSIFLLRMVDVGDCFADQFMNERGPHVSSRCFTSDSLPWCPFWIFTCSVFTRRAHRAPCLVAVLVCAACSFVGCDEHE